MKHFHSERIYINKERVKNMQKKNKPKMIITRNLDITFEEAFEEFIKQAQAKKLSPETIKYYSSTYRYFVEFAAKELEKSQKDILCKDVTKMLVSSYTLHLLESTKGTTITSYLRGVRAIINYGIEQGIIAEFKIIIPKEDDTGIKTYTDSELAVLLKTPDVKTASFAEIRNWVMTIFLLGTGLRATSVCMLNIEDVEYFKTNYGLRARIHYINTKGRREETVPLSSEAIEPLKLYLKYRKGELSDPLFCNVYGERLTRHTLYYALKNYNKSRGISQTGVHKLRHTFARNYLANGGDSLKLMQILGHTSLDMTRRYARQLVEDLEKDYDEFTVLSNFKDEITLMKKKRIF